MNSNMIRQANRMAKLRDDPKLIRAQLNLLLQPNIWLALIRNHITLLLTVMN